VSKRKLAAKLKVPKQLCGEISQNDLERIAESLLIDQMTPPEPAKPKPAQISPEFDWEAACKAFRVPSNKEYRAGTLMGLLSMCVPGREHEMDIAASLMIGLKPRTTLEVLLLSQMAAVHMAALYELGNLPESVDKDLRLGRANRLHRTFAMQCDALAALRGKGRQRITVKHFNVNNSGQAQIGVRG